MAIQTYWHSLAHRKRRNVKSPPRHFDVCSSGESSGSGRDVWRSDRPVGTDFRELESGFFNVQSSASSLQPIGVTETHPFWSVRDQAFVPIGKLSVGDEVITLHGESKRITSILLAPVHLKEFTI
ncbi:MAG: hypothetical protein R3C03_07410 [Pirellulaceae bacterium]